MSTKTETATYDLGWADCRKREVEPLLESRDALLAAAKAIDAGPWLPICKEREQLRQAIALCEKP